MENATVAVAAELAARICNAFFLFSFSILAKRDLTSSACHMLHVGTYMGKCHQVVADSSRV